MSRIDYSKLRALTARKLVSALKSIIQDAGWNEDDLKRLNLLK